MRLSIVAALILIATIPAASADGVFVGELDNGQCVYADPDKDLVDDCPTVEGSEGNGLWAGFGFQRAIIAGATLNGETYCFGVSDAGELVLAHCDPGSVVGALCRAAGGRVLCESECFSESDCSNGFELRDLDRIALA